MTAALGAGAGLDQVAQVGRRRWAGLLLAATGGAAAALAHPPFGVWPGVFGFGLILHALDEAPSRTPLRSAFLRGWAAGFGYLLVGTWWITEAFFVDAAAHAWQAPFALMFTAGGIGVFWGGAGLAYRLIAPKNVAGRGVSERGAGRIGVRILTFAAVLTVFEWLRGHVLTGFPWDLPGEAWRAGSAPSQAAAWVGAYGLTFITIAIGAASAVLLASDGRTARLRVMATAIAALAALWALGAWRLSQADAGVTPLRLRIVQSDLGESAADADLGLRLRRFLDLTALPSAHPADVVIWPEGAIPDAFSDYLAPGTWTEKAQLAVLRPGQTLLVGGYRIAGPRDHLQYFNTLLALRRTASGLVSEARYDKYRLVPFGEFLPLRPLFARLGITSLVQAGQDFTPGPPPAPIAVPGLPRLQPLICYEALFPGFTSDKGGRPRWIVNISDDAWFGRTTGPLQHLNLASYRAIEEGLPIVRSTPTGVSAVIDAYGRIRASLGLSRAGVIDARLPVAIATPPYSRLHDLPLCVFLLAALSSRFIPHRER